MDYGLIKDFNKMANEQEQKEILLALYQEYREHARHSESTRESANNFMLAIAAAILTIITSDVSDVVTCSTRLYLSIVLSVLGLLSAIFSVSYTIRYHRNRVRGKKIIERLDELFFTELGKKLKDLKKDADTDYHTKYGVIFKKLNNLFNTHLVWILFPLLVFGLGIYLCFNLPGEC